MRPKLLRWLSRLFLAAALLLSHAMCIDAAYRYARMEHFVAQTPEFSAPAGVALLLAVPPYALGILFCLVFAYVFWKGASL